jgi:hypothetical protein
MGMQVIIRERWRGTSEKYRVWLSRCEM